MLFGCSRQRLIVPFDHVPGSAFKASAISGGTLLEPHGQSISWYHSSMTAQDVVAACKRRAQDPTSKSCADIVSTLSHMAPLPRSRASLTQTGAIVQGDCLSG